MRKYLLFYLGLLLIYSCHLDKDSNIGHTSITKWHGGKKSAVSITYDDGIINQFTVAKPIMDELGMPATFYIITGKIKGSGQGKFVGRAPSDVIKETASTKTNQENFFERASLIAFTGTTEAVEYHSNAGSLFERGKITEAYELIDEGFERIRRGQLKDTDDVVFHNNAVDTTTWEDLKRYAKEGHEIASHTVTHARLAVLDEANLLYELEQSKADVQRYLGEKYTFSAECPYGTENERVMEYAHKIYPSLRNRMPEDFLDELNRSSKRNPGDSQNEYVQWQRGPLTNISMNTIKSWVDTCVAHDNIWLILVFHGVDDYGWEPKTKDELAEYFKYINDRKDKLWVATFADVTKYIRERKNAVINSVAQDDAITVNVSCALDPKVYNIPLTIKTYVPSSWRTSILTRKTDQEDQMMLEIQKDTLGTYVLYSLLPGEDEIRLTDKL